MAIARALADRPAVGLADERAGQLDAETTAAVLDLLFEVREVAGAALEDISHDDRLVDRFDDKRRLEGGALVAVEG